MVSLWVVNASPIILLAKVGRLELLQRIGPPVVIPEAAVREIGRGGPSDPGVQALAGAAWLNVVDPGPIPDVVASFNLGDGESAVLACALANSGSGAILDDQAARNGAAALKVPHLGTLGVIVHAKSQGHLPAARPVLENLRLLGMYVSDQLLNQVLAQVGE